jgi:hypothetical protein
MIHMQLTDILMDSLPDEHPWEGNVKGLVERLIANGVTVQKWISVEERLPEVGKEVLICDARDSFLGMFSLEEMKSDEVYYWFDGDGWRLPSDEVTHWMPLPEPPKDGGDPDA